MYSANLQQIFSINPSGKHFESWVVYGSLETSTEKDNFLRNRHRDIDTALSEQNVNYSEITTLSGKQHLWKKFNVQNKQHPVFIISSKYPDNCKKNDKVLIIDWGEHKDIDKFKTDVMKLVTMFSDGDFLELVSSAYDKKTWDNVIKYLKKNGLSLIRIGVSIIGIL